MLTRGQILRSAETRNRLHQKVEETFAERDRSQATWQAWTDACREFNETIVPTDYLWLDKTQHRIKEGDREVIEDAILFLDVDPWYDRSGYLKERLVDSLRGAPLTDQDKARIRQIVINMASGQNRREFRRYCSLAAKFTSPEFEDLIERMAKEQGPENQGKFAQLLRCVREHQEGRKHRE